MQPVCRITAGTRFRFAPMKGLPCMYTTFMRVDVNVRERRISCNPRVNDIYLYNNYFIYIFYIYLYIFIFIYSYAPIYYMYKL